MTNESILAAFERIWYHILIRFATKQEVEALRNEIELLKEQIASLEEVKTHLHI